LLLSTILALLLTPILLTAVPVNAAELPNGPYPDKLVLFYQGTEDAVVPQLESDDMGIYLYYLVKQANRQQAQESAEITTKTGYCGSQQFLINPLETTTGFNPFSLQKVREALNILIDRNYIVNEIYKGQGSPRWTMHRSVSPDYARVVDTMKILESKYAYNFEKAKADIFNALSEAGATLQGGKWYYDDSPIVINGLIRTEDERKDQGDYLSSQLEKVGFTVNRLYKPSRDAYLYWSAMAPTKSGSWHFYTGGWANTAIVAYEDDTWFYYSEDNAPLFGEHNTPPLLKEALETLNNGLYKSAAERNKLVESINTLALQDGVHIWVIDQAQSFPASATLGPYAADLYGTTWSMWAMRTFRIGTGTGGEVKAGTRSIFIEGFNPVCGYSWLYDVFAYYLFSDVAVWPHPHTGRYIPVRSDFAVVTAGPDGKLDVPSDALKYDLPTESFISVGSGNKATSKVTVSLEYGKWHYNLPATKADFLYTIAELYKITTSGNELYDAIAESAVRTVFRNNFVGIKFLSDSTAEIYINYWHVDDSFIAYPAIYPIFPDTPWELVALGNKLVAEKKLAWSMDQADILGVEMMDCTKGPSLALLKAGLDELLAQNYIPNELKSLVTSTDAAARWSALSAWHTAKGHFLVSNGPYMFGKADTAALQITFEAFRNYPYKADKWDSFLTVKVPDLKVAQAPSEVVPGLAATFNINSTVAGLPYNKVSAKYIVTDSAGVLVASGASQAGTGGVIPITLPKETTANLATGTYKLTVIGVGEEAALPSTLSTPFTVIPALAYFERLVSSTKADLNNQITALEKASASKTTVDNLSSQVASMQTTSMLLGGVAVVALIVAALAVMQSRKKS